MRLPLRGLLAAMLAAFTIFLALGGAGLSAAGPAPGAVPFTFRITTLDGQTLDTGKMKGSPVVINFWASWCYPCRLEAATLENAYRKYGPRGVKFLGVAVQDTEKDARDFIRQYGITYPNGLDRDDEIGRANNIYIVPMTVILDRKGEVAFRFAGMVSAGDLEGALETLLK